MAALKVIFQLIFLTNQNDGRRDPETKKLGTKIEYEY